ncbi:MAG TPA: KpsF/GutQ family sugar-phosphate isomerase [Segetibacter sp.]|jgi:arabinose-5-phosphate isomerase
MKSSLKDTALKTIDLEARSIAGLAEFINEEFEDAVEAIFRSKGRLVVSGIGKSAIVAQKIVATLNSTGTPSLFMHAADAIHGDLGMVREEDIVMILSKSGESPEIKVLVPLIKNFGNKLIGMCGNQRSYLTEKSDYFLNTTVSKEACPNNLAPTSSTTAQMVMGDAIAVCLIDQRGFTGDDFAKIHPGGNLGKRLYLRVQDLYSQSAKPQVALEATLKEVIVEISEKRLGATVVLDHGALAGLITDGDLRRMLEKSESLDNIHASDILSRNPKTIGPDELAVNALDKMRTYDINQLVVIDSSQKYLGILHLHDLVREGIV